MEASRRRVEEGLRTLFAAGDEKEDQEAWVRCGERFHIDQ